MRAFANWAEGLADPNQTLVFVGLNAPFDWSFVNYYFHKYLGGNPFGFAALDIKAYYMGRTGCAWSQTKSSAMAVALTGRLMNRRTVVVEGPLAFRMRRLAAARGSECGLQILTLPLLAARLAGGFRRPARSQNVEPAIRLALDSPGFVELEVMRPLPGMTRSIAWTLSKAWDADLPLAKSAPEGARLADLALLEQRVTAALPAGAMTPRALRDLAS